MFLKVINFHTVKLGAVKLHIRKTDLYIVMLQPVQAFVPDGLQRIGF
jgi:hypothetical protein